MTEPPRHQHGTAGAVAFVVALCGAGAVFLFLAIPPIGAVFAAIGIAAAAVRMVRDIRGNRAM